MSEENIDVNAIVIGGGFYGAVIASYLKKTRRLGRVILLEQEAGLLTRASYNNQARVHNGYHYPRSFTTAFRSKVNFPRFVQDWPQVIKQDFVKLYAIPRRNSKITAKHFERFCQEIGAKIEPAEASLKRLFEPLLIEEVFLVEEYAFDAIRLKEWAVKELKDAGVEVHYSTRALAISRSPTNKSLTVTVQSKNRGESSINCKYIFNCTYSGLNQYSGDFSMTKTGLKHEVTEMALMRVPDALKEIGVTVMDGAFFSMMPFPARAGLHTLSHVRYTPHFSWQDELGIDPYRKLAEYNRATRVDRMVRDAGRYLPSLLQAKYVDSLFEVKTVLEKSEGDDGRPILFEKHEELPGFYSVLGGKIDNIYDILERISDVV
ncbi:MAG: FAD-dependent oxidoreductase [Thalassolituus oleivorans]|uniref:FAD-dependent oxidoreductase n=1 Tax=Thalassolituus oleivorans TaxID=187493 RepID=UPI001B702283|nr:FAD-dependent oxidoreductase [Thalassolituus oleivorans]MBQ0727308.1 FAD-dependent oxidoreductase [Thalassolituus oleivorans]MBQ0780580.1 FAD-dependent oxidoreductase [Thalassolituus oleivorans]